MDGLILDPSARFCMSESTNEPPKVEVAPEGRLFRSDSPIAGPAVPVFPISYPVGGVWPISLPAVVGV